MNIVVNTRLLLPGKLEGIGWFTHETMRRVVRAHPEHTFHFLFDRDFDPKFIFTSNVIGHVVGPPARHPLLYRIWYQWRIPRVLRRLNADIFISPDAQCSLHTKVKQLLVIHDLNFEHYPEDVPAIYTRYLKKFSPRFASFATRIATVSHFSKNDIVEKYKISSEKIDIVYNGVHDHFTPLASSQQGLIRERLASNEHYFVFVSSIHPRKNLQRLIPAFDLFKKKSQSSMKLVVVGEAFWFHESIRSALEKATYKNDIVFTGRLESEELYHVLASAYALVYPSYFEGFGIPVIEAFKCGVPVITSNVTSLPEVAGDAAILIDPFDIEKMATALEELYTDQPLRNEKIALGQERAKLFSWDQSATQLWSSIEKTLAS
jgi:glycosyltransferase involved in cell wall biosynthesis